MSERTAKDLRLELIRSDAARRFIEEHHYSGKTVQNSQIHIGIFLDGILGGVLQFGPSLDKRKMLGLVRGTRWNEFLELNRMALADWLPRNSESRAISIALRMIRKHAPQIKWIVSYADATQCGDGTIYRASGFVLTLIKRNTEIWRLPDGRVEHTMAAKATVHSKLKKELGVGSESSTVAFRRAGAEQLRGFQLRYIYFLHPEERKNLAVKEIPFSEIERVGAVMYRGKPRESSSTVERTSSRGETDGSSPILSLDNHGAEDGEEASPDPSEATLAVRAEAAG